MTNEKTAVANDETTGGAKPSCSQKTTKSSPSRERCFQDALEDDEVREVLRGAHQLPGRPTAKKTLVK